MTIIEWWYGSTTGRWVLFFDSEAVNDDSRPRLFMLRMFTCLAHSPSYLQLLSVLPWSHEHRYPAWTRRRSDPACRWPSWCLHRSAIRWLRRSWNLTFGIHNFGSIQRTKIICDCPGALNEHSGAAFLGVTEGVLPWVEQLIQKLLIRIYRNYQE